MLSKFIRTINYLKLKKKFKNKLVFNRTVSISFNSAFEGMNQTHSNTKFSGYLGYGTYIGEHSKIFGKVGRFTSIGSYVRVNNGAHPYTYPYVSTAPCFIAPNPDKVQNGSSFADVVLFNQFRYAADSKYPVIIGNDVWIGDQVFIVGGCTINDGAMVLAKACVTKDVPPYAIVGGVPAKILGYRYSEDDINFLLSTRWWDKSIGWISDNYMIFSDFDTFRETILKQQ